MIYNKFKTLLKSPILKNKHGFTLIELIVVIVILGVLAAVAVPAYQRYVKKSRKRSYYTTQVLLRNAIQAFSDESNGVYPTAAQLCCAADSVLYENFSQLPVNPYCTADTSTVLQNKAWTDTEASGVTLALLGWSYVVPTETTGITSDTIQAPGTGTGNCNTPTDIDDH